MKRFYKHLLFAASGTLLLAACKKELSTPYPRNTTPLVRTTFEGVVKDQDNLVIDSAQVTAGGITIYTDANGYYKLSQVLVDSSAAVIIAGKPGYDADTAMMVTHSYATHQVVFTLNPSH